MTRFPPLEEETQEDLLPPSALPREDTAGQPSASRALARPFPAGSPSHTSSIQNCERYMSVL